MFQALGDLNLAKKSPQFLMSFSLPFSGDVQITRRHGCLFSYALHGRLVEAIAVEQGYGHMSLYSRSGHYITEGTFLCFHFFGSVFSRYVSGLKRKVSRLSLPPPSSLFPSMT